MTESTDALSTVANSFNWPLRPVISASLLTVLADLNGKLLESVASAEKEWAEFVHRRVKEDIAASQQLMNCKSLDDMQQVYSQYMRTAIEQYREQSEKAVERGKSTTNGLARTLELGASNTALEVRH